MGSLKVLTKHFSHHEDAKNAIRRARHALPLQKIRKCFAHSVLFAVDHPIPKCFYVAFVLFVVKSLLRYGFHPLTFNSSFALRAKLKSKTSLTFISRVDLVVRFMSSINGWRVLSSLMAVRTVIFASSS